MPSPSSTSDSIACFTCIGLGLLTAAVQEPAQANAVNYGGETPLLAPHPNSMLSDPLAPLPSSPSRSAASLSIGDDRPELTLPQLTTSDRDTALATVPLEPLGTLESQVPRSVSIAAEVESMESAEGFDTSLAFQPLEAEAGEMQLQPEPLQTPIQSARTIAATAASAHPTYQAITTPPLIPMIAIGAARAAEQSSFDPAERFVYRSFPPSGRSSLNGIEVVETASHHNAPVDLGTVAPAIAPMVTPVTPVPPVALGAPVALGVPSSESTDGLTAPLPTPYIERPYVEGPYVEETVAQSLPASPTPPSAVPSSTTSGRADDLVDPNQALTEPIVTLQSAFLYQDDDLSARARLSAIYPITSYLLVGGSIDLTEGDAFIDSELEGVNINELYVTVAPPAVPNLRVTLGQIDLTSYFDRNSFAKDAVTHFFNPIFQTNPALATSGIGSRQGILANWAVTDDVRLAVSGFSSDRSISEFELDAVAAELGVRVGNGIIRGTYVNSREAGTNDGPADIFSLNRGGGEFGVQEGDREEAFGLNAEYFIPEINLGLFARFGHYNNQDADFDANTVSGGINLLDVFTNRDRLGLAYGESLSGGDDDNFDNANALELFYDLPIRRNLRAGVTLQQRDDFSETVVGFRIRNDFNILP